MANYRVESIGASFNSSTIDSLSKKLTAESQRGWELHTVFSVEKTGCFGMSEGRTYLAVFRSNS